MAEKHQIEYVKVGELVPYAKNARTHSKDQVAQLVASIKEFGFTSPVLIDADGGIIAGHGRVMAAKKSRMREVPCIRLAHLTEDQKRAYVLVDNQLGMNSAWDMEILNAEIQSLSDSGFELSSFGLELQFSESGNMDSEAESDADADIQDASENPEKPQRNEYPVYISLSKKDYARWKELRGKESDTECFLRLIGASD